MIRENLAKTSFSAVGSLFSDSLLDVGRRYENESGLNVSTTFKRIKELVDVHDVRISEHGYDELENDGLTVREIVKGAKDALLVEDYPNYPKGVPVLVLQRDCNGRPVHVVWGIPKGHSRPAVLVTAYRPDTQRWNDSFTERKS